MTTTRVLAERLGFPESTRWRDGRAWLCNWGSGEILAVGPNGESEVIARLAANTLPFTSTGCRTGGYSSSMDRSGNCWCKREQASTSWRISRTSAQRHSTS